MLLLDLGHSGSRGASWSLRAGWSSGCVLVVHGRLAVKYAGSHVGGADSDGVGARDDPGVSARLGASCCARGISSCHMASPRRSGLIPAWSALTVVVSAVWALGSVAVAHAAWQTPVSISSRGSIGPVSVAVNARGDAIAAWARGPGCAGQREVRDRGGVQAGTRFVAASGQGGHRPPIVWPWSRRHSAGFRCG